MRAIRFGIKAEKMRELLAGGEGLTVYVMADRRDLHYTITFDDLVTSTIIASLINYETTMKSFNVGENNMIGITLSFSPHIHYRALVQTAEIILSHFDAPVAASGVSIDYRTNHVSLF